MAEKKRAYCKNTVPGRQRGKKYPAALRAEVVMAMLSSSSICAVARKYRVPESTIRSWLAEEAKRGDVWAEERRAAAREIALRASLGTRAQVTYLQGRVEENQRAAQITKKLHARLDEDARARSFAVGTLLKDDAEEVADATETGLPCGLCKPRQLRQAAGQRRRKAADKPAGTVRRPDHERQGRGQRGPCADDRSRAGGGAAAHRQHPER